ncbi:MAG: CRISPR-associated protein Cas5 [Candidatus Thorarchaeota archaeon]|nr:MAG: CRISPR-associated protein Cas5 [Candidatus Thorarchaeota archaeon]
MELLVLTVTGPVASFRRPLDLNYQRTLPLPPPTTLIGIAGAALGLSDLDLWSPDSPLLELKVSVLAQPSPYTGGPPGRARDMWTVLKIKDNRIAERSPYFRELLFYTRYTLLYGGPRDLLENLAEAFMNPSYPLSLGRDDELLWIESPPKISPLKTAVHPLFSGTAIPGDIRNLQARITLKEGSQVDRPIVEAVPIAFSINRKRIRRPIRRMLFTFLPLSLSLEIDGIKPIYLYEDRCFTWMNP